MFAVRHLTMALALLLVLVAGCTSFGSVDGVSNLWREIPADSFQEGVTTQAEVLDLLGPPSQLINLKDQSVFYYLAQRSSGTGRIFVVWNKTTEKTEYDRAIFFFDTDGILEEFAFSEEEIPR